MMTTEVWYWNVKSDFPVVSCGCNSSYFPIGYLWFLSPNETRNTWAIDVGIPPNSLSNSEHWYHGYTWNHHHRALGGWWVHG
jgi:hypothetical protein